jgi:hypothetical protein
LNQPVEATIQAGTKLSGVLRRLRLRTPAVVLAEGWPSWLEVLSAIGYLEVKVWCQDADVLSTHFRDSQGNYIFDQLNNLSQISKFGSPMLFVSGSRSFVKKIEAQFRGICIWATVSGKGSGGKWEKVSKLKAFSWKWLKHVQVGGITDGSLWVGCNKETKLSPALDPNYRCLKDILSPVQPGFLVAFPLRSWCIAKRVSPK